VKLELPPARIIGTVGDIQIRRRAGDLSIGIFRADALVYRVRLAEAAGLAAALLHPVERSGGRHRLAVLGGVSIWWEREFGNAKVELCDADTEHTIVFSGHEAIALAAMLKYDLENRD
jgi:hypothetical protein